MITQRPRTCQAQRQADQMRCARCGLLWDTNDPEPPACPRMEASTGCTHDCNQGRNCTCGPRTTI